MRNYLIKTLKEFKYDQACADEVIKCFDKIKNKKDITKFVSQYKDTNYDHRKVLKEFEDYIKKKYKINTYISSLMFSLLLTKKARELYKKHHYSYQFFYDTFIDIKWKAIECKLVKHTWGTFVAWWFDDYFCLRRFSFGRLQFEWTHFEKKYQDEHIHLTPDMRAVYVHIPRNGQKLEPTLVKDSINRAIKFFRPYFNNGPILFKCESWIMYPQTIKFLNKDSNMMKFVKLFKIYGYSVDKDQSEMWRLFDNDVSDLSQLEAHTSLTIKYLNYLKKGGKVGEGFGFFIA